MKNEVIYRWGLRDQIGDGEGGGSIGEVVPFES